jgi:protein arginine kinase activator
MKCEACGKNQATVHITENISDKAKRREIHLCEECAREKGNLQQPSLSQVLGGLVGQAEDESGSVPDLACPKCGMTYAEFRAAGRLGCPEDYRTFKKALLPFLEKIHGGTRHTGKAPAHLGRTMAMETRLAVLHKELEKAVKEEDFEAAAEIRDRIGELKEKRDGTG